MEDKKYHTLSIHLYAINKDFNKVKAMLRMEDKKYHILSIQLYAINRDFNKVKAMYPD